MASTQWVQVAWAALGLLGTACGARSALDVDETLAVPTGGAGGEGGSVPCEEGERRTCGTDVGICELGVETCHDGVFGRCEGQVLPAEELCNDLDDDCDGEIDEPFGLGSACDGPDSDLCADDLMTCEGCTLGPDTLELCNGTDDNCNGIIDSDCEVGDCQPTLEVTGSTPSSPSCIDFPVTAGSTGTIHYPCTGGPVTATLGEIEFTGSVVDGYVTLDGVAIVIGPDDCLWQTSHHVEGVVASGELSYFYAEDLLTTNWPLCWSPCTEYGDVAVSWVLE